MHALLWVPGARAKPGLGCLSSWALGSSCPQPDLLCSTEYGSLTAVVLLVIRNTGGKRAWGLEVESWLPCREVGAVACLLPRSGPVSLSLCCHEMSLCTQSAETEALSHVDGLDSRFTSVFEQACLGVRFPGTTSARPSQGLPESLSRTRAGAAGLGIRSSVKRLPLRPVGRRFAFGAPCSVRTGSRLMLLQPLAWSLRTGITQGMFACAVEATLPQTPRQPLWGSQGEAAVGVGTCSRIYIMRFGVITCQSLTLSRPPGLHLQ